MLEPSYTHLPPATRHQQFAGALFSLQPPATAGVSTPTWQGKTPAAVAAVSSNAKTNVQVVAAALCGEHGERQCDGQQRRRLHQHRALHGRVVRRRVHDTDAGEPRARQQRRRTRAAATHVKCPRGGHGTAQRHQCEHRERDNATVDHTAHIVLGSRPQHGATTAATVCRRCAARRRQRQRLVLHYRRSHLAVRCNGTQGRRDQCGCVDRPDLSFPPQSASAHST